MKRVLLIPGLLAIVGAVFLTGGVSAYFTKVGTTVVCEACGMEIRKDDPSTFTISTGTRTCYGCCPICALMIGIYYENASISCECLACGKDIAMGIVNGNLSSVTPTGDMFNVSVVFGMACIKNKIVCCDDCANTVRNTYEWAKDLPVITLKQAFNRAKAKVPTTTISPREIRIPELTYALLGAGIVLIASSPIAWKRLKPAEK